MRDVLPAAAAIVGQRLSGSESADVCQVSMSTAEARIGDRSGRVLGRPCAREQHRTGKLKASVSKPSGSCSHDRIHAKARSFRAPERGGRRNECHTWTACIACNLCCAVPTGNADYRLSRRGFSVAVTGSRIIVLGAGVCGLVAGMLLRRDGHEVTVLERDPGPVPSSAQEAWEHWTRAGVRQFRQPHYLQSRGRIVLEEELPDVVLALEAAGGLRFDPLGLMPPTIIDRSPRDGDERFKTITARRAVIEQVLSAAADAEPGLRVSRGVGIRGVLMHVRNGIPHVSGVRSDDGKEFQADLVVDAMGRRSQLPSWLEEAGARPIHEEVEDSGFIYYTRYFRSLNGERPQYLAPLLTPMGTFSLLTLQGDNDTWSVTIFMSAGDRALKRLREPAAWTAVVAACPRHAHWLDGEPISDVIAMAGVTDRYRRFAVDGHPVATGIAAVGDAAACTNPTNGRGMSLGLMHVQRLREVTRAHLHDRLEFAAAWDAATEAELVPWYRENVEEDRARIGEIEALRSGHEPAPRRDSSAVLRGALLAAVPRDPDAFRAFLASRCCLTPLRETFADQQLVKRIRELASHSKPPPQAGPDRAQVLQLLDRFAHGNPSRRRHRTTSTRTSASRLLRSQPRPSTLTPT
jgi:2-polyprenyl-6-methoxyphenol hydroxylase-like FAD-dependent oxidoreductase